jgi:hypothetical protein
MTASAGLDFSSASEWNGRSMATFSPTKEDVNRYQHLRAQMRILNRKMIKTIPKQAYDDIGDAIGIRRNGVIVLETEDESCVLTDACLFDWLDDGKNVVEHYWEKQAAGLEAEDGYLLKACLGDEYRILTIESFVPGAGVYCRDLLKQGFLRRPEKLFLMDVGISQSPDMKYMALATRTICFGEYWITTGAALPITAAEVMEDVQLLTVQPQFADLPGSLLIVRACLAAGASEQIRYDNPPKSKERVHKGSTIDPTDLCRCRSGLMYKYCCGRVKAAT